MSKMGKKRKAEDQAAVDLLEETFKKLPAGVLAKRLAETSVALANAVGFLDYIRATKTPRSYSWEQLDAAIFNAEKTLAKSENPVDGLEVEG